MWLIVYIHKNKKSQRVSTLASIRFGDKQHTKDTVYLCD